MEWRPGAGEGLGPFEPQPTRATACRGTPPPEPVGGVLVPDVGLCWALRYQEPLDEAMATDPGRRHVVESARSLNRRAVIVGEGCTDLKFQIRSLVGDDVPGRFHPLALFLHPRVRVSPEGSQIDLQVGVLERRASAGAPMPLLQNQAGLHPRASRHRRFHLPRHLGHQVGQTPRSQLGPQPAPCLVRQDHSRAYVLVRDMQQEVRALVEPASGPTKPKHTPATCPQLPRRIRLDTETASQVGAAAQQSHRTIHLLLGVSSRAEPWELFSWCHVTFARNPCRGDPAPYNANGPSRKPVPRTQLVAGASYKDIPLPSREPRRHRSQGAVRW